MYGGVHFSPDAPDPDNISRMDMQVLPIIADMHHYGIRLDIPHLQSLTTQIIEIKRAAYEATINSIGGYQYRHSKHGLEPFKISSRDHLSQLLFEELRIQGNLPLPMTPKGKRFEVSEEVLKPFSKSHPCVEHIMEWHKVDKLQNTYTEPLQLLVDNESRLHTSFNVTVAATGRLSSSNPNLQNIPIRTELGKLIRGAFIASRRCVLVSCDLSQIEMVWAAHRSQDPVMLRVFRIGEDIHTRTACNVFGYLYEQIIALERLVKSKKATEAQIQEYADFKQFKRLPCKTVGFGVLYGQTAEGLQKSLAADGVFWTIDECQEFIDTKFFQVYAQLKAMLDRDYSTAFRFGMIWDDFGRVRLVPEAKSCHKRIYNEGTRKAGNHPEQAGAQGTIKLAMAEVCGIARDLNKEFMCRPLLQIHDQLIFEVETKYAEDFAGLLKAIMENASPLSIPVRASADIGNSWMEL